MNRKSSVGRTLLLLGAIAAVGCVHQPTLPMPVHRSIDVYNSKLELIRRIPVDRVALQHPLPSLPGWFKNMHAHSQVRFAYKVCVGEDGHVSEVVPIQGVAELHAGIMKLIQDKWTFQVNMRQCFVQNLVFDIN